MTDSEPGAVVPTQADREAAEQWRSILCHRDSEYEGDAVADLASDFARHRLAGISAGRAEAGGEQSLPDDVKRLVIAARTVAFGGVDNEDIRALDKASEAFADRVPWDEEPEHDR